MERLKGKRTKNQAFPLLYPRRLKRMNVRWQKLLVKTTLWLVAEIWLNFLGIDNLADYSEFIFERNEILQPMLTTVARTPIQ